MFIFSQTYQETLQVQIAAAISLHAVSVLPISSQDVITEVHVIDPAVNW